MGVFEAKVTSKGQITLPSKLRSHLGLKPGDKVVFVENKDGTISVESRNHSLADLRGIVGAAGVQINGDDMERWIDEARAARWTERKEASAEKRGR